jgi:hypothetical protein
VPWVVSAYNTSVWGKYMQHALRAENSMYENICLSRYHDGEISRRDADSQVTIVFSVHEAVS